MILTHLVQFGFIPGASDVRITALTLADYLERAGTVVHTLFELSVTHPTPHTWYLAPVDLVTSGGIFDPAVFVPGSFETGLGGVTYQGLVKEHSGVAAVAALGGMGGDSEITLTLINALGTGGPGRKFMDIFAEPVPGYSEPYDLLTATLQCRFYWPAIPGEPLRVGVALALRPEGFEWVSTPGEPEAVRLTFGPDPRRYPQIPVHVVTPKRYPHAPDASVGQPVVPWFAGPPGLRVPCIPLDSDGGLHLIGASSLITPLGGVPELWTLRPEPGADSPATVALPVQITTAGQVLVSIPPTVSGDVLLTQVAQRFTLGPKGAFAYGLRLWLKRVNAAVPAVGSLTVALVLDADGLPGDVLVDQAATAEVNAAIVTTGAYLPYDIPFQANSLGRAVYVLGRRGLWGIVKYAKTSGDLHLNIDTSGAFAAGILATKATATDEAWKLTGKQQRRGLVRLDYTGGGTLVQNIATGVITTKAPVTVPGL